MIDILLQGITSPLRLDGAERVLSHLPEILTGWPYRQVETDHSTAPFFSIRSTPGDLLQICHNHVEDKPPKRWDAINAICDAISALAMVLPAEDARLICLHAAGVEFAGALVIFPNIRRAGKSTLCAALAQAGRRIFSDDVVPLSFTTDQRAFGHALGIAPRLRLPLPETSGVAFRDWATSVIGPRNRQYGYLQLAGQPPHGTVLPVGAFVILDRQEEPVTARIEQVTPDKAMDALLHQNFSRDRHSGDVLRRVAGMLAMCPAYLLTYSDLDDARRCLEATFTAPVARTSSDAPTDAQPFRLAELEPVSGPALSAASLGQRPGTEAQRIGETLYLADADGKAIHRLDPLAATIWDLMSEAASRDELVQILCGAFPEAEARQIAADLDRLLKMWARAGLIEATRPA